MNAPPSQDDSRQYNALRRGAALVAFADRGEIAFRGADGASFLHNFCTNDIKGLAEGQGCEAFFCNLQGKILGHAFLFREEGGVALDTVAGECQKLADHLDRYLIREDVAIEIRSDDVAKLLLCGEGALELLRGLTGASLADELYRQQRATIDEIDLRIRCLPYVEPRAYCLVVEAALQQPLRERLVAAGAVECSRDILDAARIESGTPLYGTDISDANLPQEVGRDEQAISFHKGCYLGQETVARIDALGHVNRQLVGVRLEGESAPAAGAELTFEGEAVGRVTSASWSPALAAVLALGYVKTRHADPGTVLACGDAMGEVVALPVG
ncbi:MAG: glycine cleavage T C-terminal barrel domain-containing protein [Pirellulaceae bacterium]